MDSAAIVVTVFGIFCIVGGVIGFAKAASMISLVTGGISGILLLICAWGISQGNPLATIVSLILALALGGRFFGTWMKNKRVMPDLIMVILAVVSFVVVVLKFF